MAQALYVYFHGQPGSPEELSLVRADGWRRAEALYVPNRAAEHPRLTLPDYLDRLTQTILERRPQGPVRLVGFSLGGVIAIEAGLRLIAASPAMDVSLDLISTPAPLSRGDFLPAMAGGIVFSLARRAPPLFGLLTSLQGGLSRLAPGRLFDQLFATAAGADKDLAREPAFRATLQAILSSSLRDGAEGYRREVLAYVAQDGAQWSRFDRPVRLWHGLADTWTPPEMTGPLAAAFPQASVTTFEGPSHYSTLRAALPEIFRDLT